MMADVMLEIKEREKVVRCPQASGYTEILRVYGNPLSSTFKENYISSIELPFPLYGEWEGQPKLSRLLMHKLVIPSLYDALKEILELVGEEKLHEDGWDKLGDAWSVRKKKDGTQLSCHSWGIAIDLNPLLAPWLKKSKQPKVIVDAFEKRGWTWGGRWKNLDGMHFQAASNY